MTRDVVIISVCHGPAPGGKMHMNFGPINQSGGKRRLNVAFSRAKKHMVLVSSIRSHAITNDYNDGARCLKNYLRYAEAASSGDTAAMDRVLRELAWDRGAAQAGGKDDAVIGAVAAAFDAVTSSSCASDCLTFAATWPYAAKAIPPVASASSSIPTTTTNRGTSSTRDA